MLKLGNPQSPLGSFQTLSLEVDSATRAESFSNYLDAFPEISLGAFSKKLYTFYFALFSCLQRSSSSIYTTNSYSSLTFFYLFSFSPTNYFPSFSSIYLFISSSAFFSFSFDSTPAASAAESFSLSTSVPSSLLVLHFFD